MLERLKELEQEARAALESVADEDALREWNRRYLGRKKGRLPEMLRSVCDLPKEERPAFGQAELERELEQGALGVD